MLWSKLRSASIEELKSKKYLNAVDASKYFGMPISVMQDIYNLIAMRYLNAREGAEYLPFGPGKLNADDIARDNIIREEQEGRVQNGTVLWLSRIALNDIEPAVKRIREHIQYSKRPSVAAKFMVDRDRHYSGFLAALDYMINDDNNSGTVLYYSPKTLTQIGFPSREIMTHGLHKATMRKHSIDFQDYADGWNIREAIIDAYQARHADEEPLVIHDIELPAEYMHGFWINAGHTPSFYVDSKAAPLLERMYRDSHRKAVEHGRVKAAETRALRKAEKRDLPEWLSGGRLGKIEGFKGLPGQAFLDIACNLAMDELCSSDEGRKRFLAMEGDMAVRLFHRGRSDTFQLPLTYFKYKGSSTGFNQIHRDALDDLKAFLEQFQGRAGEKSPAR